MAPSPVPQWLSDSPGKTCHCLRVLLSGKANPERTHQGRPSLSLPPSFSCATIILGAHSSAQPAPGRLWSRLRARLLLAYLHWLTASSQDGMCSSVLGRSGIGNLLLRNSSQVRSPYNPGSPLQVCVSLHPVWRTPSCPHSGSWPGHLMSLLAFLTFQKSYCNVIIIDFSTMHTR